MLLLASLVCACIAYLLILPHLVRGSGLVTYTVNLLNLPPVDVHSYCNVECFILGLASLDEKLYCIGGCLGQKSSNECHVYDPQTNEWETIAPLNTGLYHCCLHCYYGNSSSFFK